MLQEMKQAFEGSDFTQVIRLMDRHFGESCYSLKSLFKDEQRKVLDQILVSTREDLENRYRRIAEQYTPLMRFLKELNAPYPGALQTAADFILQADICRAITSEPTELDRLRLLCEEAKTNGTDVFDHHMAYLVRQQLSRMIQKLAKKPDKIPLLASLEGLMAIVRTLPMHVPLARVQNAYYEMLKAALPTKMEQARAGDADARAWTKHFLGLGEHLNFALPASSHEFEEQTVKQAA
jgi:hypothetical protein